jgi:hypothetical protein
MLLLQRPVGEQDRQDFLGLLGALDPTEQIGGLRDLLLVRLDGVRTCRGLSY